VKTYSPDDIIINFAGLRVQGYAKGTFIKVARNKESFTLDVGSKGDSTQVESLDKSGTVAITLQAESATNDDFSTWLRNAELRRGPRSGDFQMTNLNGATLHHSAAAFIAKMADEERADDAGTTEWTIVCADLDMFVGGAAS
jgi:hypothetical protein